MLLTAFTKFKLAARGNPVNIYSRQIDDDVTCVVKFSLRSLRRALKWKMILYISHLGYGGKEANDTLYAHGL